MVGSIIVPICVWTAVPPSLFFTTLGMTVLARHLLCALVLTERFFTSFRMTRQRDTSLLTPHCSLLTAFINAKTPNRTHLKVRPIRDFSLITALVAQHTALRLTTSAHRLRLTTSAHCPPSYDLSTLPSVLRPRHTALCLTTSAQLLATLRLSAITRSESRAS